MGDLIAICVLVVFAAVVFSEYREQSCQDRADRESMREFDAWREALR